MSSFIKSVPYNNDTKNQMWMSMISDGHDIFCGCCQPFAHLLDSIFPEGHTDRDKTIREIITRDKQLCLSGGEEEEDHGLVAGDSAATLAAREQEEKGGPEEDGNVEELLAAVRDAEAR